ncbi:MAG: hypothetical protein AAB790_00520 [Patescibacteria group bacterium]
MLNLKDILRRYWLPFVLIVAAAGFYGAHKIFRYQAVGDVMGFGQFVSLLFGLLTQPMFQLYILLVTGLSSFFMIRGVMKFSPAEMAKMSGARLGFNLEIGKNFASQKADTVTGFVLLMVSLLAQILSISQPVRFIDLDGLGFFQSVFTVGVFGITWWEAEKWRRNLIRKYEADLQTLHK